MDYPQPTVSLVDVDQIIYAVSSVVEGTDEPDHHVLHSTKLMLNKRLAEIESLYPTVRIHKLFISDKNNFRKLIAKEQKYKGQRPPKPEAYELVRNYMIKRGAVHKEYLEADDHTAMNHHASHVEGTYHTVLCDQDKDLDQIVGHRVVPSLSRGGKVVREAVAKFITQEEADMSFYTQLLTGDSTDAIGGIKGIGPKKAKKLLDGLYEPYELYLKVVQCYFDTYGEEHDGADIYSLISERAALLFMKRFPNDQFIPPRKSFLMEEEA